MLDTVISARHLHKTYGGYEAVAAIDLDIRAGEVFAFLGPNGAGKTTTVEILEGYRAPTSGQVRVLGADPRHATRTWRHRVGVVLQESQPEPELSTRECLQLYAGYYTHPRPAEATLALVGLADQAAKRIGQLSGGQRLGALEPPIGRPETGRVSGWRPRTPVERTQFQRAALVETDHRPTWRRRGVEVEDAVFFASNSGSGDSFQVLLC